MVGKDDVAQELVIPCTPGRACSPNFSGYWRKKANAVKALRSAALAVGMKAKPKKPYRGGVMIEAVIYWEKSRRLMDASNAAASLKGLCDGLQDAGFFGGDDRYVHIIVKNQVNWGKQTKDQRVRFPNGCTVVKVQKWSGA